MYKYILIVIGIAGIIYVAPAAWYLINIAFRALPF